MSEMVERVSRAIEAAGKKWANEHPFDYWDEAPLEVYALAAIEAMREPTQEMLDVGPYEPYMDAGVWAKMIDAALSAPKQKALKA